MAMMTNVGACRKHAAKQAFQVLPDPKERGRLAGMLASMEKFASAKVHDQVIQYRTINEWGETTVCIGSWILIDSHGWPEVVSDQEFRNHYSIWFCAEPAKEPEPKVEVKIRHWEPEVAPGIVPVYTLSKRREAGPPFRSAMTAFYVPKGAYDSIHAKAVAKAILETMGTDAQISAKYRAIVVTPKLPHSSQTVVCPGAWAAFESDGACISMYHEEVERDWEALTTRHVKVPEFVTSKMLDCADAGEGCPFCQGMAAGSAGKNMRCSNGHWWHECLFHHTIVEGIGKASMIDECRCVPGKTWKTRKLTVKLD